ncbi:hypothetical protein CSC70_11170 [Pseudoxanthomonas kalamensis DSM 18571]|nr:hypothetical protein CSC70_11170 [Pseudoxanthomonas kalamensis DSM 18571]
MFVLLAPLTARADTAESVAMQLLDHLDAGEYAAAEAMFTPEMAAAVPADKLGALWESLPAQVGAARGRGPATVAAHEQTQLVTVPLHYANAVLLAQVAVEADGRISGFFIRPAPPPAAAAVDTDAGFGERDFAVVTDRGELPGTLAMPKGAGPFPAVVLVHGSGPQDRDETIGANRPFLDIARGLAAQGIAVLRYEKRTKVRPQDFAEGDYTMDEETTDDAVAAIATLASAPDVDPARLFVLGHSQGGMLAPRIAVRSGKVAGLILLAAPARSLLDLLPEQNRYLFGLDGQVSAEETAFLDRLDAQIAAVRDDGEVAAADSPLGLPAGYWRAFERVDPVADAKALQLPLLLLQGGRDFQVVDADWQRWQAAFGKDPRVTLRHYPALNHLGIAGQGPGSLAEYQQAGHVDPQLIDDAAAWIKTH